MVPWNVKGTVFILSVIWYVAQSCSWTTLWGSLWCNSWAGWSFSFVVFFSQTLAEWKYALSRSIPPKTPYTTPPAALPMQRSVSHSHTHTPSVLLCLRRIKQIAKKFSGHFLNEDFVHCLKDYHVSITASLRLSCSSGPSFIRPEQTVFLFYKVKRCDPLTSKPLQLSQTLYIYIGTLQIYLSASITSHLSFNLASFFLFLPALSVSTSKVKKTVQG